MPVINTIRDLYQAYQAKPRKIVKPIVIQFPVNDICNAGCKMCHVWKQKLGYQLSPGELQQAIRNPLYSEVRSVGINGGEPTLRKDLANLVDVLFSELPKLKTISLITNALVSKRVNKSIDELCDIVSKHNGKLDVMVSLDGVGEVHDTVRGRPGNFLNARTVIDHITNNSAVNNLRLGCTVIRDNVYGVHDLLDYATENNIYIKYRLGVPHKRLYTNNIVDPFSLTLEECIHFCTFLENLIIHYEKSFIQKYFYRSLIDQILFQQPRVAGCDWQHRAATFSHTGDLLYCPLQSRSLGSIKNNDSESLYFGNSEHLFDIVSTKCADCKHDYEGLPGGQGQLKHILSESFSAFGLQPDKLIGAPLLRPVIRYRQARRYTKRQQHFIGLTSNSTNTAPLLNKNSHNVMVSGWYGTETLGDKAILGGVISSLRDGLGEINVYLSSIYPHITKLTIQQMPELDSVTLLATEQALAHAGGMDLLVIGGGPIMAIDNLAEILALVRTAKQRNIPVLIAGCGVGPLGEQWHNSAIKEILINADYRIYRDNKSLETARQLGIDTNNDLVAEDPAFTWLASNFTTNPTAENRSSETPKILLGLREWPSHQYGRQYSNSISNRINKHAINEILTALELVIKKLPSIEFLPFPMCTNHYGGDDRWYYRSLLRNSDALKQRCDMSLLSKELTPAESLPYFQKASAALTMRYHSLVFSLAANLPTVAIDYTLGKGKIASLVNRYRIPSERFDELSSESISHKLIQSVNGPINQSKTLSTPVFPGTIKTALMDLKLCAH